MARSRKSTPERYSVTEAKNRLTSIVHDVEHGHPVELTRRGQSVAMIVSTADYRRLAAPRPNFWSAYQDLLSEYDRTQDGLEPSEFQGLRDDSPGRSVEL